jgi:hypothetical protein
MGKGPNFRNPRDAAESLFRLVLPKAASSNRTSKYPKQQAPVDGGRFDKFEFPFLTTASEAMCYTE